MLTVIPVIPVFTCEYKILFHAVNSFAQKFADLQMPMPTKNCGITFSQMTHKP